MKNWRILEKVISKRQKVNIDEVITTLLENRNLKTKKEIESFLNPNIESVSLSSSGIDEKQFIKFRKRIESAIKKNEKIIIYGDYDVDGITATAILWETLFAKTKNALPYIPDRVDEGYGLSIKGIENLLEKNPETKIIITVDNGIVANEAVTFANKKGIDVIVTDHHVKGKTTPEAFAILHTTSLCGAGIAWVIARELGYESSDKIREKLELAALATVADLVPLTGNNRAIVKYGLEILKNTTRVGLLELLREAQIDPQTISVYTIGHIVAPRLNATGRIQSAMNALRLLCTKDKIKAQELALMLGVINRERQGLTIESFEHAKLLSIEKDYGKRITVVAHESYNQGIIGLIASSLVESYYRPAFAIAIGEKISKGSARSVSGVNIIELIRSVQDTIIEAGGHPMAAGFSLETEKIDEFANALAKKAEIVVTDELLNRFVNIDMQIPLGLVSQELYDRIQKLAPFGMGNTEPVFASEDVQLDSVRKMGKDQSHLKLSVTADGNAFEAVGFRMADKHDLSPGDKVSIAYVVDENAWNGRISLQLKLRDIKENSPT